MRTVFTWRFSTELGAARSPPLLLLALAVPILAAIAVRSGIHSSRSHSVPTLPILVHAGIDWDWEMPAVTLAGLLCGVSILVVARL